MNFVFAGYKESYCVLEYNITCVAVNFYWTELDTSSGQIYCALDILDIILYIHITESEFTTFWTLSTSWSRQYSCVNSLNISRQTFCVTGYIKNSRKRTFCVVECETGHKI